MPIESANLTEGEQTLRNTDLFPQTHPETDTRIACLRQQMQSSEPAPDR